MRAKKMLSQVAMLRASMLFLFFFLFPALHFAKGIRGTITDEAGKPLAFASIFVKQSGTGTK
jgi:hypothetical protein